MAQTIGTIIVVVLALVVISVILNFVFGVLGFAFALLPLLIKLAALGGVVYLGWMVFHKLAHTNEG